MVYTSSRGNLKRALQLNTEVPATDAEELSIEHALEKYVYINQVVNSSYSML